MSLQLSDDEWKQRLTPEQYSTLREKRTEYPFTGALLYNKDAGIYTCAACGNRLFDSEAKFEAHCGWPNFYAARPGSVVLSQDVSHGMLRTEVTCANCAGHLGHVFDDSPEQPTGQRFCVNSASMQFLPSSETKQTLEGQSTL